VLKVVRREDTRQRSGEKIRTVHMGRMRGRDRRDLANSGVRRIKAQVLGVQSRGARTARREDARIGDLTNSGVHTLRVVKDRHLADWKVKGTAKTRDRDLIEDRRITKNVDR
jgi:hypothetical protein